MDTLKYKKKIGQKGQITVEYLLLAVVLIAFFGLVTKGLRDSDHLKGFQDKPRALFQNMVENGNRYPDTNKAASQERHPNQYHMHYTSKGLP